MLPLIGILLCIYLVFKGIEIFQIAWCSQDAPSGGLAIGAIALVISVLIAGIGIYLFATARIPALPLELR